MTVYNFQDDAELIALIKTDDQCAYTEIYNRYKNLLYNHAYKKLGNHEEVKDVLQELFTNLWNKRSEIPDAVNLSGYLYSGMRNRIFNLFSRKQIEGRYLESLQEFINEGNYTTDLLVREKEFAAQIQKEIDTLPPKMREVFLLSRKEYLSHKEIAEKLSISEQTVSKQITNALRILRLKLGSLFILMFFVDL